MSDLKGLHPNVDDRAHTGFWEAARRGQLVIEKCKPAGHVLHLPRGYCHLCDSFEVEWVPVSGQANLHTFTIVEHQVHPNFPAPYAVVLVELDEVPGVRFLGNLPGRPELSIGMRMTVTFDALSDTVTLPRWVPAQDTVDSSTE